MAAQRTSGYWLSQAKRASQLPEVARIFNHFLFGNKSNHYIANGPLYTRVLQYLNYDIAQDVYLRLPGLSDSVAASAVSYPRQYGSTGRSSVLLVFPVPDKELRHGCHVTFRGDKLALGTRRFFFTAADIKDARRGQIITK